MSEQIENQIKKELQKIVPAIYYERIFKEMRLVKLNESKVVFGLSGPGAVTAKKHIESKYMDSLSLSVANSIGKRKIELIVDENVNTTKEQKPSDKIDIDGEVHKLENYLKKNVSLRFNEISQSLEHRPTNSKNFIQWSDRDFNDLWIFVKKQKEYKYASKDNLLSLLSSSVIPTYHPIKDYFNNLEKWDKKTDWIGKVCSCIKVSNELDFRSYFEKWCIRAVYSLFSDGEFVNEHCLTIQSNQGWYKSTFINGLIPKELRPYYNSRIPTDFKSKDASVAASKIWIWLFDEIDKITNKKEAAEVRDFFSMKGSFERAAYGRNAQHFKRISSFIAACNKVEFLVDDTGNRRYIIFSLLKPIEIDKFQKIPIERFWSQVFHLYKSTRWNQIHWNSSEQKQIQENNLQYEYSNNEYEVILKYFRPISLEEFDEKNKSHAKLSATDIYLFIHEKHPTFKLDTRWIGRGLSKMGFIRTKIDKNHRVFLVKKVGDKETSETLFSEKR
ncbi:VapE domain-containing protein [Leptospira sp. WS39.C2]